METVSSAPDPLRERLLHAAAEVFARKGFEQTRIQDIVREAGLTTGAAYTRFESKRDLVREALVLALTSAGHAAPDPAERIADFVARASEETSEPLTLAEGLLVEACVVARRDDDVAEAVRELMHQWRTGVEPELRKAVKDGTLVRASDKDAFFFFIRTLYLGLLVERAAGLPGLEAKRWHATLNRVIGAFAS